MRAGTMMLMPITLLLLAGCGPGATQDAGEAAEDGMSEMPGTGMNGMGGMEGMGGMSDSGDMMARMTAHMAMMQGVRGDSMRGMLQTHRQMAGNMIAAMNREMREMDMPADAAWNATVDSLRNDLVAMPEMDAAALEALMPAHHRRMMRLMEMHEEMMADMGM